MKSLSESKFHSISNNPFTELSELRLELTNREGRTSLRCKLRFGLMLLSLEEREYEIGVTKATLAVKMSGCEQTMDAAFGESCLSPSSETYSKKHENSANIGANFDTNTSSLASGVVGTSSKSNFSSDLTSTRSILPVTAKPGDCWEIKSTQPNQKLINGTAISGTELCGIQRKKGSNRISVVGELQVRKRNLDIQAKEGNRIGKLFGKWQNKDAIIGLIVKNAIGRESVRRNSSVSDLIVISVAESMEE